MTEIVVSGIGVITSIGHHVEQFWKGLLSGQSGVKRIHSFYVDNHPNQYGCEIDDLEAYSTVDDQGAGRTTLLFLTTLEDALYDAGIRINDLNEDKIGICVGTTMGETECFEDSLLKPSKITLGGPNIIAEHVAKQYRLKGPIWTVTNACAAGNYAISRAMDELLAGRADIMIAGGVDAISWAAFTGFSSLRAMSPDVCRPFDAHRQGLLLGEGAGILILETKEHLLKRQGIARAQLLGYGLTCDGHHITQPDLGGSGAIRAMKQALAMASLNKEQIGYVSAHGTGTKANDLMEANALFSFFGDHILTSSIKGHIGHTLGAASVIEAVACIKALETGILPATINLRKKDPLCNVQVVENEPLERQCDYVMSNAYAFGGINSTIVLGKVKP